MFCVLLTSDFKLNLVKNSRVSMHLVVPSQILIIGLSCEFQHKTPCLTTQNPILNSPFRLLYIP